MKQKELVLEEYELNKADRVEELLTKFTAGGGIGLVLRLRYYRTPLEGKYLDSLAHMLNKLGRQQEFLVDMVVETNQWKRVKSLYRKLNQFSVRAEVEVNEKDRVKELEKYKNKMLLDRVLVRADSYEAFRLAFDKWKKAGLSIGLVGYELTQEEFFDWFQLWIHDPEAVWFGPFEGLLQSAFMGSTTVSCEHSSCLGKRLCVAEDNSVYFCSKKLDGTFMYQLMDELPENLYNQVYGEVLNKAIEKRKACMEGCGLFGMCKGGCIMEQDGDYCRKYQEKAAFLMSFLEKNAPDVFAGIENPCIRQLYLSLVAYGYIMEPRGSQ